MDAAGYCDGRRMEDLAAGVKDFLENLVCKEKIIYVWFVFFCFSFSLQELSI